MCGNIIDKWFDVDGVYVSGEVLITKFACDIPSCKGYCCYAPDDSVVGPPLTQAEATYIRKHKVEIAKAIPVDTWKDASRRRGLAISRPVCTYRKIMPFRLRLMGHSCIYCNADGCLLKRFPVGEPISCSLYPLDEDNGCLSVNHYFDSRACYAGYAKGERENVYLIDFLREPIVRRFGEKFFQHLMVLQQNVLQG